MRILVIDDDPVSLKQLTNQILEVLSEADILPFDNAEDTLAVLPAQQVDIAFLDIEIGDMNGIDLAKHIQAVYPRCDIVFCTRHDGYAVQAFELGASDYLMQPITTEKIEHAIPLLRHHSVSKGESDMLYVQRFGEFEIFFYGRPVTSFTKRSKELLAYLVDKAGVVCAT